MDWLDKTLGALYAVGSSAHYGARYPGALRLQ